MNVFSLIAKAQNVEKDFASDFAALQNGENELKTVLPEGLDFDALLSSAEGELASVLAAHSQDKLTAAQALVVVQKVVSVGKVAVGLATKIFASLQGK